MSASRGSSQRSACPRSGCNQCWPADCQARYSRRPRCCSPCCRFLILPIRLRPARSRRSQPEISHSLVVVQADRCRVLVSSGQILMTTAARVSSLPKTWLAGCRTATAEARRCRCTFRRTRHCPEPAAGTTQRPPVTSYCRPTDQPATETRQALRISPVLRLTGHRAKDRQITP